MLAANHLSTVQVGGTAAAPEVNLVWRRFPTAPGHPIAYEAVAESGVRAGVAGVVVTHTGESRDLGVADLAQPAAGLGF